jgi:hypothetical protein
MNMGTNKPPWTSVYQRLAGEPTTNAGRCLQLIAEKTGWQSQGAGERPHLPGAAVQIRPLEILVQEGDQQRTISIVDPERYTLRGIAFVAMMVSMLCWLTIIATRLIMQQSLHA